MSGYLDVGGTSSTGAITVEGSLAGIVYNHGFGAGPLSVYGDMTGAYAAYLGMSGDITVRGSATGGGFFFVHPISGYYFDYPGDLRVESGGLSHFAAGSLSGSIDVSSGQIGSLALVSSPASTGDLTGSITAGTVDGDIDVDGELWDVNQNGSGGHIRIFRNFYGSINLRGGVHGGVGTGTEYITIGELPCDTEANGWCGVIEVGTEPTAQMYYGNTPEAHFWELDCAKADVDNDWCLTSFDIDPFVMILMGQHAAFEAEYPGLSWQTGFYHADMDCNGLVNSFDIDPFVARLTNHSTPDCAGYIPECPGDGGGGEMSMAVGTESAGDLGLEPGEDPAAIAVLLASAVAPERLAGLTDAVQDLADQWPDEQRASFWAEVAGQLSGQ